MGDSRGAHNGVNAPILSELASQVSNSDVDLVLFTGDLVEGSDDPAVLESQLLHWVDIMQPVYDAGIDVYPVRGNHDDGSRSAWNHVFSGEYLLPQNGPSNERNLTYSAMHKNALILGLDNNVTRGREINQTWLDQQLAANRQLHVFAFAHEPAFSVDHEDTLDDHVEDRDRFWESLIDAGARAYFAGHDHFYNHSQIDDDGETNNDLHQFVVGAAGAPLRSWNGKYDGDNQEYSVELVHHSRNYGYLLGAIEELQVELTWMERTGPGTFEARDSWGYAVVPEPNGLLLFWVAFGALVHRARLR